jgi:hypothetical protein
MKSVGNLLTAASSLAPLLTFIPPPYGVVIGFSLATVGGLLTSFGAEGAPPPSTSDIMAEMQVKFQMVLDNLHIMIDVVEENRRLLTEMRNFIVLGKEHIEKVNELYNDGLWYYQQIVDGPNAEANRVLLQGTLKEAFARKSLSAASGPLGSENLRKILQAAVQGSIDDGTYTFCEAGKQARWFMATRYQLYWLLMLDARFNQDQSLSSSLMEEHSSRLQRDVALYEEVVDGFRSNYLWQAVQASPSQCNEAAFGYACASGWLSGGKCKCRDFWQGSKKAASPERLLDHGSLRVDCYYAGYSCAAEKDVYITSHAVNEKLAVWQWLYYMNIVSKAQTREHESLWGSRGSSNKWRIHAGPNAHTVLLQNMYEPSGTWLSAGGKAGDEPRVTYTHKRTVLYQRWGLWSFEAPPNHADSRVLIKSAENDAPDDLYLEVDPHSDDHSAKMVQMDEWFWKRSSERYHFTITGVDGSNCGPQNAPVPEPPRPAAKKIPTMDQPACGTDGLWYMPLNMAGQGRTVASPQGCRQRCKDTAGCKFYNNFPNGGCHITTGDEGTKVNPGNPTISSGSKDCALPGEP